MATEASHSDAIAPEAERYKPAGVFISYASEDHDIAQSFHQSVQRVNETVYDRISIFLDSKSMSPGKEIRDEITAFLDKSDFLIVIYTGLYKKSHGFTGWEVGYFYGLMQKEIKANGITNRKTVSLYVDELPPVTAGILGISINVEPKDLAGGRSEYVKGALQTVDNPDVLARLFLEIADRAEERLPPQLQDRNTLEKYRIKRRTMIAEEVIPNFRGKMFDCSSTRISRRSVEQKLIEFELPTPSPDQTYGTIPDQTKLTQHSGALGIFGFDTSRDLITWGEFRNEVKSRDLLNGSSMLLAIEQVLISAISPAISLDNDQIVKSLINKQVYRVIVARQIDYYDGRKVVYMYFIELMSRNVLGNNDTSIILSFIDIAAKYRFIFIEEDSSLSVEAFYLEHDREKMQNMTKRLIRELTLIEEEAHNAGLDESSAITKYFGTGKKLAIAKNLQTKWFDVRQKLMSSAELLLKTKVDSVDWPAASEQWLSTLRSFRAASDEINSTVATQALDNLKKSFTAEAHRST